MSGVCLSVAPACWLASSRHRPPGAAACAVLMVVLRYGVYECVVREDCSRCSTCCVVRGHIEQCVMRRAQLLYTSAGPLQHLGVCVGVCHFGSSL